MVEAAPGEVIKVLCRQPLELRMVVAEAEALGQVLDKRVRAAAREE